MYTNCGNFALFLLQVNMPPKKGKLYKMPAPLPKSEVLTDTAKQKWILGPSIGIGGFGEIYAAAEGEKAPTKDSEYRFVVKIVCKNINGL